MGVIKYAPGTDIFALAQDCDTVTLGITPSGTGELHDGHNLTLLNVGRIIDRYREAIREVRLFIDDREFNLQGPWALPKHDVTQTLADGILRFIQSMSEYFHIVSMASVFRVQRMSEFMCENGADAETVGQEIFARIRRYQDNPGNRGASSTMKEIYADVRLHKMRNIARPVCPDCGSGHQNPTLAGMRNNVLVSTCHNLQCKTNAYQVNPLAGDVSWCLNYALMGMRDVSLARQCDRSILHVYGGDYAQPWGNSGMSKALRMNTLVERMMGTQSNGRIAHVTGPLLTRNGVKLAKSRGDRESLTIEQLYKLLSIGSSVADLSNT